MLRCFILFSLIFLATFSNANASCIVYDDAGKRFAFKHPPQKIVVLSPDLTEITFAIGGGDRISGVISGSDFPLNAKSLPIIGSYTGLDLERIVAMKPDLILTWQGNFPRQIQALQQLPIPVYTSAPHKLEDVAITMKKLACLLDTEKLAAKTIHDYQTQLAALRQQYAQQKTLKVFYQLGSYSLMTVNKESWISEAIKLCGGENIFANARTIAPEVSVEAVIAADPDVILSDAETLDWMTRWQQWPRLKAVKNRAMITINPDLIDRPGPRLVNGVAKICQQLQQIREHN